LIGPDGGNLLGAPLADRRVALESFACSQGIAENLHLSPTSRQQSVAEAWLREAGQGSLDGVIAKRLDGRYEPGERAMVKVKPHRTADCVVGGFHYQSGSALVGSLLLGLYDAEGRLNHAGSPRRSRTQSGPL
jgi:ATP-dependent DNA ligase